MNYPKDKYKGYVYSWSYDEIDKENRCWFYFDEEWKYFKNELKLKNFIDKLFRNKRIKKLKL